LGTPAKDNNGKDITSITFVQNESNNITIGKILENAKISLWNGNKLTSLPQSAVPTTKIDNWVYPTHEYRGWYFTSNIATNSEAITNTTQIEGERDVVIYQVFTPVKNSVTYDSQGGTAYSQLIGVEYGTSVPLPIPYKEGHIFGGWFTDEGLTKQFNGKMPPYDLTLYAKWEVAEND
jgi:uncharacterized repeat protein (TIGR02543 family)